MKNIWTTPEGMTNNESDVSIRLPVGEMVIKADGSLWVYLHKDRRKFDMVMTALQSLKRLDTSYFLLPNLEEIEEQNGRLRLTYPDVNNMTFSFIQVAKGWRQNVQVCFHLFINVAFFAVESFRYIKNTGLQTIPISPVCLFYKPGYINCWRLLALPLLDTTIGDWSQADLQTWQWVAPEILLSKEGQLESFIAGAVLHYCLVGDTFPKLLSKRERFQRLLMGRVGISPMLFQTIRSALPNTLIDEAQKLSKIISDFLMPDRKLRPDYAQTRKYLEEIQQNLSAYRIALRWEYEEKPDIAIKVLLTYADLVAPNKVPWETIARLQEKICDWDEAIETRLKALQFADSETVRESIQYLCRIAAAEIGTTGKLSFQEAFDKIVKALPKHINDLHLLQLAYLEMRHLKANEQALRRIAKPFHEPWNQVLQFLIKARIMCYAKEYSSVSKICKSGITLLNNIPNQGGNEGLYAVSYFYLLDGIAHFGAVGRYQDVLLLTDSFSRFTAALDVALKISADDLVATCIYWLTWLKDYAIHFSPQVQQILITGIEAYLCTKKQVGTNLPNKFEELPSIPWCKEELFFPYNTDLHGIK